MFLIIKKQLKILTGDQFRLLILVPDISNLRGAKFERFHQSKHVPLNVLSRFSNSMHKYFIFSYCFSLVLISSDFNHISICLFVNPDIYLLYISLE